METEYSSRTPTWAAVLIGTAVCVVLLWIRYALNLPLLFHTLAELFAITVAVATFMVTWNARRYITSGYLLILGISYFFIAGVDLLHMVAYKGMNLIPGADIDLPTQLWVAGRYLQVAALLIASAFIKRKPNPWGMFIGFGVATLLLLITIAADIFPTAFGPDGLTSFKIVSEYLIAAGMLVALYLLYSNRSAFDGAVWKLLAGSIVLGIASELSFTLYIDPFGYANTVGHVLRIIMYYLIYRAIVEASLKRPYDVLFRELTETAHALRESETRFRSTFEQATLGIGHIGLDGRWARVNPRLSEIAGYPHEDLESRTPESLTHPDDTATERGLIERLELGDIPEYRLEKRILRHNGGYAWVNAARAVVRGSDGEPIYYVETIEDITQRKRAEEEQTRTRVLGEALNTIDRTVLSTLRPLEMLSRVMADSTVALDVDAVSLIRNEDGVWRVVDTYHGPQEAVGSVIPRIEGTPFDRVLKLRDVVALSNTDTVPEPAHTILKGFGIRSYLTVPLISREEQYGVLVYSSETPRDFTIAEMNFARKLSAVLTVAMQNATLYNAERKIADTLQTELLGIPAHVAGLELAHAYRSATKLARIGGDFYDVFEVRPGLVFFVLGDVSGKGIEAATLTAMAKSTIRAFAYHDASPATVLDQANRVIAEQIGEGRFITVVVGTLEIASGDVTISSAGHPAPILCGKGACVDNEIHRNPPLGLFPDQKHDDISLVMESGDMIVLFSDGLLDARSGSDIFGEEGVHNVLAEFDNASPDEVVAALLDKAESHAGGEPPDDIAIVAMRYLGV